MKERKRKRLESVLRDVLGSFFREELDLPLGSFISIQRIELGQAGTLAKVFLSVYPQGESRNIEKKLKLLENRARRYVSSHLTLKYLPEIRFLMDKGEELREKIERILEGK